MSVNAAPEPVTKGEAITVTGSLTRGDWVKQTYTGSRGAEGPAASKTASPPGRVHSRPGTSSTTME